MTDRKPIPAAVKLAADAEAVESVEDLAVEPQCRLDLGRLAGRGLVCVQPAAGTMSRVRL